MQVFDDTWSSDPWNHPDDPYPLLQLSMPPPTGAAGSDTPAESAIADARPPPESGAAATEDTQEATVQQQQPQQPQLLEGNIDMSSRVNVSLAELAEAVSPMSEFSEETDAVPLDEVQIVQRAIDEFFRPPGFRDSQIPGPRDSQIPGSRDSQIPGPRDSEIPGFPDSQIPGFRMSSRVGDALAEQADDLSPLSEISEVPVAVPLDEGENADSAIDEFMEDPASPRATSLASTTSLAPHIEGDDDWDVLIAAEMASSNARRFCFVPPPPPPLTAERDSRIPDEQTVQAVPHPPPCPPPAHLLIAQAHGGIRYASLGRQSKAAPSKRHCGSTRV